MPPQPDGISDLEPTSFNDSAIDPYRTEALDNYPPAGSPITDVWPTSGSGGMIGSLTTSDIIIAVMGPTGAGKSTFINIASGTGEALVGHRMTSCTQDVQPISYFDKARRCRVVLVDTPGFDDTHLTDFEVLRRIAEWLKKTHGEGILLSGILILHRISDNRIGGTPLGNLKMFRDLCGKNALSNVVLVTTMWDEVTPEEGRQREEDLRPYWKDMLEHGARVSQFHHTEKSAQDIISRCRGPRHALSVQAEMGMGKPWYDTSAARTLLGSLAKQVKRFLDWLRQLDPWKRDEVIAGFTHHWKPLVSPSPTPSRRSSIPSYFFSPRPAARAISVPSLQTDFPGSFNCSPSLSPASCPSPSYSCNSISEQIQELTHLHNSIPVSELQDTAGQMLSIMERIRQVDPDGCIVPPVERTGSLTISFVEHARARPSIPNLKETVHQFQIVLSKMDEELKTVLSRERAPRMSTSDSPDTRPQPSTDSDDLNQVPPLSSDSDSVQINEWMEARIPRLEALFSNIRDCGAPCTVNILGGNFPEVHGNYFHIVSRSPSPDPIYESVDDPQPQPKGHCPGRPPPLTRHTL